METIYNITTQEEGIDKEVISQVGSDIQLDIDFLKMAIEKANETFNVVHIEEQS